MGIRLNLAALLAVSGVILSSSALAQDSKAKSAELQVLDRYVGTWEERTIIKPAVWTPEQTTSTTTTTRQWILNGTMIENKGAWLPGENEFLHLMTYDPQREEYRQWYFDKDNLAPQATRGKWDEATQTFTFTGILADGIRSTGQQKFSDEDTFTWTMVAKDGTGKVVLDTKPTGSDPVSESKRRKPTTGTWLNATLFPDWRVRDLASQFVEFDEEFRVVLAPTLKR